MDTAMFIKCTYFGAPNSFKITILMFFIVSTPTARARFSDFYLKEGYDRRDRPGENEGKPLIVSLKIQIQSIRRVEEMRHELELEMYVQRTWIEDRLLFNKTLDDDRYHIVDNTDTSMFWMPDFYVQNLATFSSNHGSLDLQIFMINRQKRVIRGEKARMVVRCAFKFELYPLDVQECPLDFMSPLRTEDELIMNWWNVEDEFPVTFVQEDDDEFRLPTHKGKFEVCNDTFVTVYPWGNVSTIRIWLVLERELKAHMLETYVPTILFVIMSWGSFLVKPEVVPGRMVLLVTNLLSLVTMFEAIRSSTPPALGVKTIDVWLLSCILFVFFALLEYAVVLFRMTSTVSEGRVKKIFRNTTPEVPGSAHSKTSQTRRPSPKAKTFFDQVKKRIRVWFQAHILTVSSHWCLLDKLSFISFPVLFIFFNIVYWSVYVYRRNQKISHTDYCAQVL